MKRQEAAASVGLPLEAWITAVRNAVANDLRNDPGVRWHGGCEGCGRNRAGRRSSPPRRVGAVSPSITFQYRDVCDAAHWVTISA